MDNQKLLDSLAPLERKVLPHIAKHDNPEGLMGVTGLSHVEVMRAVQWLENKGLVNVKTEPKELVSLDDNGRAYLEKGLPERRFLV